MDYSKRRAYFALGVLFAINTMNFYDRQIVAALNEPLQQEFKLDDSNTGDLNTAFVLLYAAVGVPLGRLSDRFSRTRILSAGVGIWSLMTAGTGLARTFPMLVGTRLGVGVGEATCAPAANSLVGDLFSQRMRARAISVMMLGLPIGIFLSSLISPAIGKHFGWRSAFFIACIPGLVLAVLMVFIPEPTRGAADQVGSVPIPVRRPGSPFLLILGTPTMLWIIISGALHNFNTYAVMGFLQAFIQRYHKLPLQQAGYVTSIVIGAVGVVGMLGGGWVADRVQRVRPDGRLRVASLAMLVSAPCLYMGFEQPRGAVIPFMALTGLGIMFIYVYYAGVYAAIQDVIEPGLRATAMAVYFCAMYVLGGSLGSSVTGRLSVALGKRAMIAAGQTPGTGVIPDEFRSIGLHQAMYVVPVLCLALAAVLYAASRTVKGDMQKLAAWRQQAS